MIYYGKDAISLMPIAIAELGEEPKELMNVVITFKDDLSVRVMPGNKANKVKITIAKRTFEIRVEAFETVIYTLAERSGIKSIR